MATLTILGLGPGSAELLTAEAVAHLQQIEELTLRTQVHPTVGQLPAHLRIRSFDALYETATDFAAIYRRIAEELVARAARGEAVTYAVPGHPLVAEATTRQIRALARERGIDLRIIAGLSFLEPVCEALDLDPFERGLQLVDALEFGGAASFPTATTPETRAWAELQGHGPYEPPLLPFPVLTTQPVLIAQLYNRRVASMVKLALLARYLAEHPVTIVRAAGVNGQTQVGTVALHELDHDPALDHLTVAYLPPLPVHEDVRGIDGIHWVIARLLGPAGCPWDREQTHHSLRPFLLEEAHEVLEALDANDPEALSEELGDLLLQIMLHSEMARQAGDFDFGDVTAHIATKLIRRHPHVFGDIAVGGTADVLRNWEAIKAQEHAQKGKTRASLLDGIPVSLPALAAAQKLGEKAANVGFDWPDVAGVWAKVHEEIEEIHSAAPEQRSEEFGDLLFVVSRLASWLDVDAETALREANAKFRRRFAACEGLAEGRDLKQMSPQELDVLWEQAKRMEV
ncbi:MAG TPA: nucleoside triphosphate pyrophosphohydrolase [Herpetosiphonaceae bacterium]